jgi:hypothetical protein
MNFDSSTTSSSYERQQHFNRSDRGQATSEYALVMLAAALIALLAVGWASSGDGAGKIGQMFDRVIEDVTRRVP